MTSRTNVSFKQSTRAAAATRRAVTEALENRQLFAVGLVSVALDGGPANGASGEASVSADGRYVVFTSLASNLVAGDTNNVSDVFLRDRQTNTTTLISRAPSGGAIGNDASSQPVINQDGTFVAFVSKANNLLPNDTLGFADVFRYNIATGALELVSATNSAGTTFGNGSSSEPTISKTGQFVSFTSFAPNIAGVDGNAANDVFRRNMSNGSNTLVSVNTGGTQSGGALSFDSWISADGQIVTFRSDASNLVAGDTNGNRDTFLRNLGTSTTTIISQGVGGAGADSGSESNAVSGDGRFVVFQSRATNLVSNDGNGDTDVFLRDTTTGTTRLLSVNRFNTNSAGGFSEFPAISQNGDWATFSSLAPDIVTDDANGREDIFVRDLARGPMTLVSRNTSGAPANGRSFDPFVNQGGTFVVYTSDASDLAANDTNGRADVFINDIPQPGTGGPGGDTTAPTAAFGTFQTPNAGDTTVRFTVTLNDNAGLNTVSVGNLTVTRPDSSTATTTLVSVVGTGTTATVTYDVALAGPASTVPGAYTVSVPAGALKDAAGNNVAGGGIGGFTLSTATNPGDGTGSVGDPFGPDLQITSISKLPASAIGSVTKGKLKWKVVNGGPGLLNANTTFSVYLSADQALDTGDVKLTEVTKNLKKVKATKAKSISAKWVYPDSVGNGNFFVLVEADSAKTIAESNEANNTTASATTVLVQPPFVDLQPTTLSKPSKTSAGATATVSGKIQNNGNVSIKAATPIDLVIVNEAGSVDSSSRVIATITPNLSIKAKKAKGIKFKFTWPSDLAAGNYELAVRVDPTNTIAESNEGNNSVKSFVFTTT